MMRYLKKWNDSGFVLMLVLSVLAVMIVMVVSLIEIVREERRLSSDHLNKTRSRLLAYSGVQYALSQASKINAANIVEELTSYSIGRGTFSMDGDIFELSMSDSNGKININDGIEAGRRESAYDNRRANPLDHWTYSSSTIEPWPDADININLSNPQKSGLLNLRLRRILNAYGDILIANPVYEAANPNLITSTAIGDRGVTTLLSGQPLTGLGDIIVSHRPEGGYKSLHEIKNNIFTWITTIAQFPTTKLKEIYEKISSDLTVVSFQDTNFYRLRTETAATIDASVSNLNKLTAPYMWHYQNDFTNCKFTPNYLDRFPIDLTDDSQDEYINSGNAPIENALWADHSVALINLNVASTEVTSAVFYSLINVSYSCEGAVTHSHYAPPFANFTEINTGIHGIKPRDDLIRREVGVGRSSIGVRGPCFNPEWMPSEVEHKNRFISLSESVDLAEEYDNYLNSTKNIYNFDDFKKFLTNYRKEQRKQLGNSHSKRIYERAAIIPLKKSGKIKFDDGNSVIYYGGDSKKKVRATFFDESDTNDTDIVWVSQYWPRNGDKNGPWDGGWFLEDYVERTLPHVLSCVRRIPGYLGAPLALTSPYMIVEPFAYVDVNNNSDRDRNDLWSKGIYTPPNGPANFTTKQQALDELGHQPKVSVEDLVTRHTLPKVCFLSPGYVDISSVGRVISPQGDLVSQTTIKLGIEAFKTKYFRTQKDFVSLMARDSSGQLSIGAKGIAQNLGKTHEDIVIGPEFKFKDPTSIPSTPTQLDRVRSKYWLTCGLSDAHSQAGDHVNPSNKNDQPGALGVDDSVKSWDLFLEGNPNDIKGGLNQIDHTIMPTLLPDYGSPEWDNTMLTDTRRMPLPYSLTPGVWPGYSEKKSGGRQGNGHTDILINRSRYFEIGEPAVNSNKIRLKFIPRGSGIMLDKMEDAATHVWAKKDGHDLDPFGGGIFISSNGNGEFADKHPDPNPYDSLYTRPASYEDSPKKHRPRSFRDTLFWRLETRLKDFDKIAKFDSSGELIDTDADGIADNYEYVVPTWSINGFPYGLYKGEEAVNPAGVNFHRGFASAWFRIPTSYPFAQPVYYHSGLDPTLCKDAKIFPDNSSSYPIDDVSSLLKNKTHLFKTIFNLNHYQVIDGLQWSGGIFKETSRRSVMAFRRKFRSFTTHKHGHFGCHVACDIQVGYFSGFDTDTQDFSFEHGIVGYYNTSDVMGFIQVGLSSTKWAKKGAGHPLSLSTCVNPNRDQVVCQQYPDYHNKVFGYFWDYDYVTPTPFKFSSEITRLGITSGLFPKWANTGDFSHLGEPVQTPITDGHSAYVEAPFHHIMWKQRYDVLKTEYGFSSTYGKETDPNPVNHLLYESHVPDDYHFTNFKMEIQHKLKMNTTPECAPGSWHRIHAFWFMRFNPGQMGINDPFHEEMGDTEKYSDSSYWQQEDPLYGSPHNDLKETDGSQWNPKFIESTPIHSFDKGRSRYATDDYNLGLSIGEGHGHYHTNAAFDVDGLDQFGIWFRDDSNYDQFCLSQDLIKPKFTVIKTEANSNALADYQTNTGTVNVSVGSRLLRRGYGYIPASGERPLVGTLHEHPSPALITSVFPPDPAIAMRHYPGNVLDSTVDDFIFGYGTDISVPFTGLIGNVPSNSSYFRGLFHNAKWLARSSYGDDPYKNRHADEVRYDIRDKPALTLNLNSTSDSKIIPENSIIMHVGSRIYFPRDTLIMPEKEYNHSDLRLDVFEGDTRITKSGDPTNKWYKHSDNYQDHFFNDLQIKSGTDLFVQFQYTGMKRKLDNTEGSEPVVMMSTIYNYMQNQGATPNNYPTFDNGDSFTNIPYIQELSLSYFDPKGYKITYWSGF